MNEFAIEWIKGRDYAGVTVPSGSALKSKLMRYAESRPNEVKIMSENNDGSMFFHIPVSYVKISPPRNVSEEQREAAGERFRKMWKKGKGWKDNYERMCILWTPCERCRVEVFAEQHGDWKIFISGEPPVSEAG